MSALLVLLFFAAGDDPPGAALPNQEELVATLRSHLAKREQPLDNFVRRQVTQVPAGDNFTPVEMSVQVHGGYCKTYTRDARGVERVEVMNPSDFFHLTRVPTDEAWKLSHRAQMEVELRTKHKSVWYSHA